MGVETDIATLMAKDIAAEPTAEALVRVICARGYALVPIDVINSFPEINPSNYDHDDAIALNAWGVELVNAATM